MPREDEHRPPAQAPWSKWRHGSEYTLGIEEEVMLLDPSDWTLAPAIDEVLAALPDELSDHVSSETHSSAVELRTGVHATVGDAVAQLGQLRAQLSEVVSSLGLAAGASGTHPSAVWHEMRVSSRERHQEVYGSMRELAHREPTFALHVHVGVPSGVLDCGAFPDPTYLWWDVRPQPKLGTVEVRIMDTQSTLGGTAALVALVQSLVRLELVDGHADAALVHAPEVLDENRFLAARDGADAELVDPVQGRAVSVVDIVADLMLSCAPHAAELGCAEELKLVAGLLVDGGPARQRRLAERDGLVGLVAVLAEDFRDDIPRANRDLAA